MMTNRLVVRMYDYTGRFAEDKDVAKKIREEVLWSKIQDRQEVELDFANVDDMTQSFVHALLSKLIRETQGEVLDLVYFKHCSETVKGIVNMVVDYMMA